MGRIKKTLLIDMPLQQIGHVYGGRPPFEDNKGLVKWLNEAQVGSGPDQEASRRVRTVILRMHGLAATYKDVSATEWGRDLFAVAQMGTLRIIEPGYTFNFDLYPPLDFGKWRLQFIISFSKQSGEDNRMDGALMQQKSRELAALAVVVDLALKGRLETVRQCDACGRWFIAKNDPRRRCCPSHTADDLRRGTPERKAQLRRSAKDSRERARKEDEQWWTDAAKQAYFKGQRRPAQRNTNRSS